MSSFVRRAGSLIARLLGGADPVADPSAAQIYAKDVGGVIQVFAIDSSGTVHQLTPPGGAGGPVGTTIEVVSSTAPVSTLPNGRTYIPLRVGQSDEITAQIVSAVDGDIEVLVSYGMSAANAGDVDLALDTLQTSVGDNPADPVSAGPTFTVVPGNDVLLHEVSSADSVSMKMTVTKGQNVLFTLKRPVGDTHTGDMRIFQLSAPPL